MEVKKYMKTKIKRHSRSVISVLLSVCMLISCMTVGLIATDAANVTDSETVGGNNNTITDYYFKGSFDNWAQHYVYFVFVKLFELCFHVFTSLSFIYKVFIYLFI